VTAQNTLGVTRVDALAPEAVVAQIEAVVSDIGVQAAKTGMLLNAAIMSSVAETVQRLSIANLVVDPVMVSRQGDRLMDDLAIETMRESVLPLARVATPNRYEAEILADIRLHSVDDMVEAAIAIRANGPEAVVVKGGGMTGSAHAIDVYADADGVEVLETEPVQTSDTHGTGCTLSAAIAAQLARGQEPREAVRMAKQFVTDALGFALRIGSGQGPVGHFYRLLT
jgi:hydroxymethylpyrimidine/phosphomethylpyrimidine kinase